jgi:hypothetical protein
MRRSGSSEHQDPCAPTGLKVVDLAQPRERQVYQQMYKLARELKSTFDTPDVLICEAARSWIRVFTEERDRSRAQANQNFRTFCTDRFLILVRANFQNAISRTSAVTTCPDPIW